MEADGSSIGLALQPAEALAHERPAASLLSERSQRSEEGAEALQQSVQRLGCNIVASYCAPRAPFSSIDFLIRPARVTVYRDALGMTIAAQAMIISLCKSADFLLGFLVGKLSDATRTRWGRRKPFLAVCSPVFMVCTLLLGSPGLFFSRPSDAAASTSTGTATAVATTTVSDACTALVSATNVSSCADLRACIDAAVAIYKPLDQVRVRRIGITNGATERHTQLGNTHTL